MMTRSGVWSAPALAHPVDSASLLQFHYVVKKQQLVFWGTPLRTNETEITLDLRLCIRKVKKSCKIVKLNYVPQ
jgi:hypothetical protein